MVDPSKVDPDSMINPSSNLYVRNPSHQDQAERAKDQEELVEAIREVQGKRRTKVYTYEGGDTSDEVTLPGVLDIRSMKHGEIQEFCKSLMRLKPNITRLHLSLGDYPNTREFRGPRVQRLQSTKPRNPTEIAEDVAELMHDSTNRVVELDYQVNNAKPGQFEAIGKAWVADESDYQDDSCFNPVLTIDYVSF
jgi:hypothetical protein